MNDGTQRAGASLWAKFVFYIALIGLAALPVGALGSRFGAWLFTTGFQVLFGGVLLAAIALVLGIACYIRALMRGRDADKMLVIVGVAASVIALGWMGLQYATARSVPAIHNISTDVDDPPSFQRIADLRGPGTNAHDFDAEDAEAQAEGYPDLAGVSSAQDVAANVARAAAIARDFGWEVVNEDAELGLVEATETTFWFGFKDDVVIRVRAEGTGSLVDLRSVSRVGQSDLGANAARIEAFIEAFGESES